MPERRVWFVFGAAAVALVALLLTVGPVRLELNVGPTAEVGAAAPPPPSEPAEWEAAAIRIFEFASPSVVFITSLTVQADLFTRNLLETPSGTGTGFVWNDGYIVTNYHVIRGANAARVTLADGTTWPASLVGTAPEKDLAVLRTEAPAERLRPLPIGTSQDLRVGQWVYAIGNPFGLDQSLTTGVISALGREINSLAGIPIRDVIQTDAAINPGNSGGPLLNSAGRLVGVNTAIYSPSGAYAGIGFAIPVDVVRWVVPQLIAHGRVIRPTLGVELAPTQIAARLGLNGALILHVLPGSGAAAADLRPTTRDRRGEIRLGDVIVAVDGQVVRSAEDLVLVLERRSAGERVTVTIERDGRRQEVQVALDAPRR